MFSLKNLSMVSVMFLITVTLTDMIYMEIMNISNMEEFGPPFVILCLSVSFLVAFILDKKIFFIYAFTGFGIISFLHLYSIIVLAISTDNTIASIIKNEPKPASVFSLKVTSANICDARKEILVFSLTMFSIMFIMATSAVVNTFQQKNKNKQVVVAV